MPGIRTLQPLLGKVALVTGAGRMRGTGHSIAVALAEHGADVVLHGSGSDPSTWPSSETSAGWRGLESVAETIRELGREALIVTSDLRRSSEVDAMVAHSVGHFGRLDILVNNAAAPKGADRVPVVDMPDDVWENVLDVKLSGGFYASRAVARHLVAQKDGGRIVNISSAAGKIAMADISAYSVANAALQMLGACLAQELGADGITVNTLCLGPVVSSRIDDLGDGEEFQKWVRERVPAHRAATPQEVGNVVAFLCSPAASYISGQSINVDGGWVTH